MTFAWPLALVALVAAPAVLALHFWQLRRRRKTAVRIASLALVRDAVPKRSRWRRHLPPVLLAASLLVLALAAARPTAAVQVPVSRTSILFALDVSGSMCNTDVPPNRLTIAQEAAMSFVEDHDDGTRIGLVTFSVFASLVVPATTETERLTSAIETLTISRGTAIGMAIIAAIDAIAETNPDVAPTSAGTVGPDAPGADDGAGSPDGNPDDNGSGNPDDSAEGTGDYVPDIVVVLTDGANTRGVDPLIAAELAAQRGVRVYTIGFGTSQPTYSACSAEQLGANVFGDPGFGPGGPGGGGGRGIFEIDEPTLQSIASTTGGEYFRAEDAGQLGEVLEKLPSRVELQTEETELSVWFALAGAALAVGATVLALRWNRFP